MTPSPGDDGVDRDLEVVDLEPSDTGPPDPAKPQRDTTSATGVRGRRVPVIIASVVVVALVGSAIFNRSNNAKHARSETATSAAGAGIEPLFDFRVGAQVLTGGLNGLLLIDTDTGAITTPRIEGLPDGPITIVAHSGATVAVRAAKRLYWFTMQDRLAHGVDAISAFPGARRGELWLAGARSALVVPGPSGLIPTRGQAIGATRGGLVVNTSAGVMLQPTEPLGNAYLFLPAPARVIAVHPDRIAWVTNECGVLRCPVHVTEVPTGASSTWLQLVGNPSPLAIAGTSALFSPGGNYLAINVPNDSVTHPQTLIVADLRSRAITVIETTTRLEEPARPGSADATGATVDWTLDGRYLLLAPASGTGPLGIVESGTPRIISSRSPLGIISTAAAIGTSSNGAIDTAPPVAGEPIAAEDKTLFSTPRLTLIGATTEQVDAVDFASGRITTWPVGGPVHALPGPNTIARVTGGWLVVRNAGVFLLLDGGGQARTGLVDEGSLVFSANGGRDAWIALETPGLLWRVEPYDPATGTIGRARMVGTPVGATAQGLLVTGDAAFLGSEFDFVDRIGALHRGPVIDSRSINVLAAAGTHVAFLGSGGLYVLDLSSGTDRLITSDAVFGAALSPGGTALAWIEDDTSDPAIRHVKAMRADAAAIAKLGGPAERVLVTDDGTVLFTNGFEVRRGRVDANGSRPVYGLAPAPDATLALG